MTEVETVAKTFLEIGFNRIESLEELRAVQLVAEGAFVPGNTDLLWQMQGKVAGQEAVVAGFRGIEIFEGEPQYLCWMPEPGTLINLRSAKDYQETHILRLGSRLNTEQAWGSPLETSLEVFFNPVNERFVFSHPDSKRYVALYTSEDEGQITMLRIGKTIFTRDWSGQGLFFERLSRRYPKQNEEWLKLLQTVGWHCALGENGLTITILQVSDDSLLPASLGADRIESLTRATSPDLLTLATSLTPRDINILQGLTGVVQMKQIEKATRSQLEKMGV
jgi:hypothetical protein